MDRRVVLVTGASRGIGRAIARHQARAGDQVIALARSEKALTALDDEVRDATGEGITLLPLDLRDAAAIDRLAAALLERFGRLDALVANAGVLGTLGPLHMITPQSFEETIAVNLTANWRLVRALHPLLRQSQAARVVFLSSGVARSPRAYWGAYAASKAGLEAMALAYADEVEKLSIKVNIFNPGPTRTDMRFKAMPGEDQDKLTRPEQIAEAVAPYLLPACPTHGARIDFADIKT